MTFRCANRRKARRLHLAAVDCHLGDVPSEPLLPLRPVYMPPDSARCFACRRTHRMLAGLGVAAVAVLACVHLVTLSWSWP